MNLVVVLLLVVAGVLGYLVVSKSKRLQFPLLMEYGFASICIGLLLAAEAIHSDSHCTPFALTVRWSFVAGGVALVLISVARKRAKGFRRISDLAGVAPEDLKRVTGGKGNTDAFHR